MANIKSAQKRARQDELRKKRNLNRRTALKTAIKKVLAAVEKNENKQNAVELLKDAQAKLARAKSKRVIHPNTAARKMSRLAKRVAKAQRQPAA